MEVASHCSASRERMLIIDLNNFCMAKVGRLIYIFSYVIIKKCSSRIVADCTRLVSARRKSPSVQIGPGAPTILHHWRKGNVTAFQAVVAVSGSAWCSKGLSLFFYLPFCEKSHLRVGLFICSGWLGGKRPCIEKFFEF